MEVVHFVYARSKSEQSSQTNKPLGSRLGAFLWAKSGKGIRQTATGILGIAIGETLMRDCDDARQCSFLFPIQPKS